jgi:hypothetical protein
MTVALLMEIFLLYLRSQVFSFSLSRHARPVPLWRQLGRLDPPERGGLWNRGNDNGILYFVRETLCQNVVS